MAVMLAVWVVFTAATVASNVTLDVPAATVTAPGTETAALLLLTATTRPPPGATELSLNVHVVVPAPVID